MDAAPAERRWVGVVIDATIPLAVVAILVALQWPFRLHGINLIDEGAILQIAHDLLQGVHLYRDVVHPSFPGIHWAMATIFHVFGDGIESARAFAVILFALTGGALYVMVRWFAGRRRALWVVPLLVVYRVWAYPHWQMVSYSSLGVGLVLVAATLVGIALSRPGWTTFAIAGLCAGLAVLAKQDVGPIGIVVLMLAIVTSRPHAAGSVRAPLTAFMAGVATVGCLSLGYVIWDGIFFDLIDRTIVGPLHGLQNFPYFSRPPLRPLFAQSDAIRADLYSYMPTILLDVSLPALLTSPLYRDTWLPDILLKAIYYLPIPVLAAGVLVAVVQRVRGGRPTLAHDARFELLVWVAAGFLLAFNRPHDWIHLLVLYPPTLILGAALVARVATRAIRALTAACLVVTTAVSGWTALGFLHATSAPLTTPHGVFFAAPAQADALRALLEGLRDAAPPDTPMIAFPYHPLLHYLADRPRVPPYAHVWPIDADTRREATIIESIERHPDTLVVYSTTQVPHFSRFNEFAPVLHAHLAREFEIRDTFGGTSDGYTFLLLRRRRPEQSVSLLDALVAAPATLTPAQPSRNVPPVGRTPLLADVTWPFARVLRTALIPDITLAVSLPLRPVVGDRLVLGYGFNPDHWTGFPLPRGRFAVAIRADGAEHVLADREVFPSQVAEDRRWHPVDVDLTPWVGRNATLELRVTGVMSGPPRFDVAGFTDPRIVTSPRR